MYAKTTTIIIIFIITLFIMGCAPTPEPSHTDAIAPEIDTPDSLESTIEPDSNEDTLDLSNSQWDLISMDDENVSTSGITLDFGQDNGIGGLDGCNRYGTTYHMTKDGGIQFSPETWRTLILCSIVVENEDGELVPDGEDEIMELGDRYINALLSATHINVDGNTLIIQSPAGKLLYQPAHMPPLQNTSWTLSGIGKGDVFVGTYIDLTISLRIVDGEVTGFSGCNNYGGIATINDFQITFGELFTTEMHCSEEDINEREAEFLAMLSNVHAYTIFRQKLTLLDKDGAVLAEMSP